MQVFKNLSDQMMLQSEFNNALLVYFVYKDGKFKATVAKVTPFHPVSHC